MRVILKPGGVGAVAFVLTVPVAVLALTLSGRLRGAGAGNKPVASFPFDENKGMTSRDTSPAGLTAQLVDSPGWAGGIAGSAVHFEGARRQYADLGSALLDTSQSFSVSCWVKLDTLPGFQTFVSQDGGTISGFYLQKDLEDKFAFTRHNEDSVSAPNPGARATTGGYKVVSRLTASRGAWYHLVGLYDADVNTMKLYVNTALEDTLTLPSQVHFWKAGGRTVAGAAFWKGDRVDFSNAAVDNIRLYQRVLTEDEIRALFKAKQ